MLKVTKEQILFAQAIYFLVFGVLGVLIFTTLNNWLGGFVWTWSPWEHWYGWIIYVVIRIYAFIGWAFSWVAKYAMWFTPIVMSVAVVMAIKDRS